MKHLLIAAFALATLGLAAADQTASPDKLKTGIVIPLLPAENTPILGTAEKVADRSKAPSKPNRPAQTCLIEFFRKIGLAEQVQKAMPFQLRSPNAIPPAHTIDKRERDYNQRAII